MGHKWSKLDTGLLVGGLAATAIGAPVAGAAIGGALGGAGGAAAGKAAGTIAQSAVKNVGAAVAKQPRPTAKHQVSGGMSASSPSVSPMTPPAPATSAEHSNEQDRSRVSSHYGWNSTIGGGLTE
ncbi:MAG: hypothetical protein WA766_11070 [Candidatus Acidiferrales bacterium]